MLTFYLSLIEAEEEKTKFTKIYSEYLDWMLKISYHFTKNIYDSEEIVHDVFMELVKFNCSIPTHNSDETKAYLFICLRNRANMLLKDNSKLSTVSFDGFFNLSGEGSVEDEITNEESYTEVESFISTMKPIYRDVLTLHFFYDKSLKEIAEILNIPFNTVSTRFKRGKAILKERFKDLDI